MKYCQLGRTDISVSKVCLGTMTWGEQNSEAEAHDQLDFALDAGVNFIDTAEMYPVPPKEDTYGLTETVIGTWLQKRNNRDQIILASKVAGKADWLPYIRDGNICLDKRNIESALDASLTRLRTDYIDLYQLHWPDRNTNFFGKLGYQHRPDEESASLEESLHTLTTLVQKGKIRQIGISNETPWGAMHFLHIATQLGLSRIVSIQNPYNLLNRSFEIGLAEISHREDVGLMAYSPLAFGVLSGKYLDNRQPPDARLVLFDRFTRYTNEQAQLATRRYVALATEFDLDPAQMALAYVTSRPFVTSTIIGATTLKQLRSNLASIDLTLPNEVIEGIDSIHMLHPNPGP
ncbi:MAG: NADP(H)-dependent aldo-keto reductase [Gammaproteobacteria bacterium]